MMPKTIHGLSALRCVSAMQKCIRRAMEREAMEFAVELMHTSKAYTTLVCNRLQVISHEDVDTAMSPYIVPFVSVACRQALDMYDSAVRAKRMGKIRMPIGNAIRMMSRAPKSREADHFSAAIGLRSEIEHYVPTIPDWADDQHTSRGRKLGRGVEYFRMESTKLVPPPEKPDAYIEECYRLRHLKLGTAPTDIAAEDDDE